MSSAELSTPDSFETAWSIADRITGWCTRDQALALWTAARRLPAGMTVMEIGSHQGRSTLVLALAVQSSGGTVQAVDPFVEGRVFGGQPTRRLFERHLAEAGVADLVELHSQHSGRLRPDWQCPLDLLYIDGKHDYWTVRDDLRWGEHLPPGGQMFVHDAFSSIGVTAGLMVSFLLSSQWVFVERTGSLALFARCRPSRADRLRMLAQLPWFVGNVGIKVLLRLHLRAVARALGHHGTYDPY